MLGLDNPIHLLILLAVLLLVFGAKRLPELGRSLGAGLRGFKESISGEASPPGATELNEGDGGRQATSLWEGERKVGVRVKLPAPQEGDPSSVGRLDVPVGSARVPLSTLAKVHGDLGRTQMGF